jgi:4-hydroxy-4-methyl-2-oxoglutarate aldolase
MTASLVDHLKDYATPTLFEVSAEVVALAPQIAPLFCPIHLCGPAFTVQTLAADNLPIHRALAEAPPGVVLVVATGGDTEHGFWGEIMLEAALAQGVRGLVIDGAVRDTQAIRSRGFPVFSQGIAIPGTDKRQPGELNTPVRIAGVVVHPGDWIVGDDDGVVVVPEDIAESVVIGAEARARKEADFIRLLRGGELTLDLLSIRHLLDVEAQL